MNDNGFDITDTGIPVVFDLGTNSIRVGFCNDKLPKSDIPSVIGSMLDDTESAAHTYRTKENLTNYVGANNLRIPREGMEIKNIMHKGMIDDWDAFENLMDYAYSNCLFTDPMLQPIVITEAPWNTLENKEKLMELMFEKYHVPACIICKSAAAAAFSCNIYSGIVIDSGATHTTAVPVYEGLVLTEAVVSSSMGGDFILKRCEKYFHDNNINVIPHYLIANKRQVKPKKAPIWVMKNKLPKVTNSWHNYMCKSVLEDFQHTVLEVAEHKYNDIFLSSLPTCHYEFPDGYNQEFGCERFKIPEILFNPSKARKLISLSEIAQLSAEICDDPVKDKLYENIVVTGGNSLIKGFPQRIQREIITNLNNTRRLKLIVPIDSSSAQYSAWIGGSLFATDRKFNNLWFISNDFYENGVNVLDGNFIFP